MPIYMNFNNLGIKGNVTAEGHQDWIELNSCQWGVGRRVHRPPGVTQGPGGQLAGRPVGVDDQGPAAVHGPRRHRLGHPGPRPLAVEPRVDVPAAEPPLPADPHGRQLPGVDQAVDRPQVHLQVGEHLVGGEKPFRVSQIRVPVGFDCSVPTAPGLRPPRPAGHTARQRASL